MDAVSDAEVVVASLAEPARFGDLFDRHATVLHRYVVRRIGPADAVASLPQPERDALVLHVWEGLAYDDIAVALDVPIGTVRSRLNRARTRLRELAPPSGEERDDDIHGRGSGRIEA